MTETLSIAAAKGRGRENVCKRGRGRVVTAALEARRDGFLIVGDCVERGRVISGGSLARHAWSVLLLGEGVGCYSGCSGIIGPVEGLCGGRTNLPTGMCVEEFGFRGKRRNTGEIFQRACECVRKKKYPTKPFGNLAINLKLASGRAGGRAVCSDCQ